MVKTTLDIDGISCGMCEAHINNAVRKAFAVKKVVSSHSKGETQIISAIPIDGDKFLQLSDYFLKSETSFLS